MIIKLTNFDPEKIAFSGQCFRMKMINPNSFYIPAFGKLLFINRLPEDCTFEFTCDDQEFTDTWFDYFDLERDYDLIEKKIMTSSDNHLKNAYLYGKGIRILKQDLFEIIISFMISQNNNIKRISNSVEKICRLCGHLISDDVYSFPTFDEIDANIFDDSSLGLGYRAPYLKEFVLFIKSNPDFLDKLKLMDYDEAYNTLIQIKGIGKKVASCILLFGLGFTDAFPVDTHIKKILDTYYPDGIDLSLFDDEKGIIQQYLFYYDLKK